MIDKEKTKREIIIDAGDIFSRFGFRKTTMSDIARKTGNQLDYAFHEYDADHSFFNLDVYIDINH